MVFLLGYQIHVLALCHLDYEISPCLEKGHVLEGFYLVPVGNGDMSDFLD
jgi:hypothetical protein